MTNIKRTKFKIGLQFTKNQEKYNYLRSLLTTHLYSTNGLEFIHIGNDNDLMNKISDLDILTTYDLSENIFSNGQKLLRIVNLLYQKREYRGHRSSFAKPAYIPTLHRCLRAEICILRSRKTI